MLIVSCRVTSFPQSSNVTVQVRQSEQLVAPQVSFDNSSDVVIHKTGDVEFTAMEYGSNAVNVMCTLVIDHSGKTEVHSSSPATIQIYGEEFRKCVWAKCMFVRCVRAIILTYSSAVDLSLSTLKHVVSLSPPISSSLLLSPSLSFHLLPSPPLSFPLLPSPSPSSPLLPSPPLSFPLLPSPPPQLTLLFPCWPATLLPLWAIISPSHVQLLREFLLTTLLNGSTAALFNNHCPVLNRMGACPCCPC